MSTTGILSYFLLLAPRLIIWSGSIGFAIYRHRKHPRISNYAIIGFTILILTTLVDSLLNYYLPQQLFGNTSSAASIASIFAIKGIVMSIISLIPWAFIFLAIFSDREVA